MYKPEWEIMDFNGTRMLIRKWSDRINNNDNVTFIVRTYNSSQGAVAAKIQVEKVIKGWSLLSPSTYTVVNVSSTTDMAMKGYGIIKLVPNSGSWEDGEYMVSLRLEDAANSKNVERVSEWFRVGFFFGGGP
jgi:hypothetical protein